MGLKNWLKDISMLLCKKTNDEVFRLDSTVEALKIEVNKLKQELGETVHEENRFRSFMLKREQLIYRKINIDHDIQNRHAHVSERVMSLPDIYSELEIRAPNAFRYWQELLSVNADTYDGFPVHSCSVKGHPSAELFRDYIYPYLNGRVLDIGCGPQPIPLYLKDYPLDLICGIDPISSEHPFSFVNGIAEFLPWPENYFDVVIAATTLDHVLLLDRVYSEVCRVLKDNGRFLIWVCFVSGASPYDPYSPDLQPVDRCHLFHFDKGWFEEGIKEYFNIEEVLRVVVEINHHFYSLAPKKQ